jgi:formylglycine-generating enzyme
MNETTTTAPAWASTYGVDKCGAFARFYVENVPFTWRWIPPGHFTMDSPEGEFGRALDEGPQHTVTISRGFWLGETPVTQAQWGVLGGLAGAGPSQFREPNKPVVSVNWFESRAFAEQLNARFPGLQSDLPTEAQWEYACRAGTDSAFNDGADCTQPMGKDPALDALGWYYANSIHIHDVRQKQPNAWGLYDMHGGVWEWCLDAWDTKTYERRLAGTVDPVEQSLDESADRVVRGGSWIEQAPACRAAYRSLGEPGIRRIGLGFRLATP